MLHVGSSKHSSKLWGLLLYFKKNPPTHCLVRHNLIQALVHLISSLQALRTTISHPCAFITLFHPALLLLINFFFQLLFHSWMRGCDMPSGQRLTWMATTTINNSGSEKVRIIELSIYIHICIYTNIYVYIYIHVSICIYSLYYVCRISIHICFLGAYDECLLVELFYHRD